ELLFALVFWCLIVPGFYIYKAYKKIEEKLDSTEEEVQRLKTLPHKPLEDVTTLINKLEKSEESADLLGLIIRQKDSEISSLAKKNSALSDENDKLSCLLKDLKEEVDLKSTANEEGKQDIAVKPVSKQKNRRQQSPAVQRLLERLLEKETEQKVVKPKSRIPSLLEVGENQVKKEARKSYNPSVWEMKDGKLVLKDMSIEAEERRRASVVSSPRQLGPSVNRSSCFVVHSNPRD
ncbi:hypothetical protein ACPV5V_19880, partial [Vibrio campbellii]